MNEQIVGRTASDIAASVRDLVDRGILRPGEMLPPIRALAAQLGVNRNTVAAAFKLLVQSGVASSRARAGTSVAERVSAPEEGFSPNSGLRDVGSGNPDPALLPSLAAHPATVAPATVLYGQPILDPALVSWAMEWLSRDQPRDFQLTVTSGAVDAVERLLSQAVAQGDAVALEDPCFLTSIQTARLDGYRTVPVAVDAEGMTVDGLRAALDAGVRAVVCTPRAHNPTGASLTPERAARLRALLVDHPHVMVIEDDHFSMLSTAAYQSIVGPTHRRWALVRSVSKFLGPDLRVAVVAADAETTARLGTRLRPGTMWVSHILQRLTHELLTAAATTPALDAAREHYAARNRDFVARLRERGVPAQAADGLNVWVDTGVDARSAAEHLMRRGWLARTGEEFALTAGISPHLRLTVHTLDEAATKTLLDDIGYAIGAARAAGPRAFAQPA